MQRASKCWVGLAAVLLLAAAVAPAQRRSDDFRIVDGCRHNVRRSSLWTNFPPQQSIKRGYRISEWTDYTAKVVGFRPDGLIVNLRSLLSVAVVGNPAANRSLESDLGLFFLKNWPGHPNYVIGQEVKSERVLPVDNIALTNVGSHAFIRVKAYDYGLPDTPENQLTLTNRPSPEEMQRAKEVMEKQAHLREERKAQQKKLDDWSLLKWHFTAASNGYAYAQCALGLRYLNGDGLPKNESLARYWLEKAAAQGNGEAKAALEEVPRK